MRMKASEVGEWLRQIAGKRDHREVLSDNDFVLRPGAHLDLFYPVLAQLPVPAPEGGPTSNSREASNHAR